jgi:subtilisin family serine protease
MVAAVKPLTEKLWGAGLDPQPIDGLPMVMVAIPASLLPAIEAWPEVVEISENVEPTSGLASSRETTLTANVNANGITGSGVAVAVIETWAYARHTGLALAFTKVCPGPPWPPLHNHATTVAGVISSINPPNRGHTYGATVPVDGPCPGDGTTILGRSTSLAAQGYKIQNYSWYYGSIWQWGPETQQLERVAYDYSTLLVGITGNADAGDYKVAAPGLGYNILGVGSFFDKDTGGSTNWSDDVMSSFSRYINPPSANSDRVKPDLVAPGESITTTDFCPPPITDCSQYYATVNGTSLAAPAVAGIAALIGQRSSTIQNFPTAIRAVLMAGAIHNIEGAARLSNMDGAGGVVASHSDAIMSGAWGAWGAGGYACSAPTDLTLTTFSVQAGQRYRAVITWFSHPDYSLNSSQPSADVDLRIMTTGGAIIAHSISHDNSYEIVDFVAPYTATVQLKAIKYRCNMSPSQLGWAWIRVV